MPKREPRKRRPEASLRERHRILVYCGGVRTEPAYFHGIKQMLRDGGVIIEVRSVGTSPKRVAKTALDFATSNPGFYNEIWCVVDVDEFDLSDVTDFARDEGIHLAISNPCFELWLLLHHLPHTAAAENCGNVAEKLAKVLPQYDKTRLRISDFTAGIGMAIERGKQLDPTGEDHKRNPSTGMWRLVERIIK